MLNKELLLCTSKSTEVGYAHEVLFLLNIDNVLAPVSLILQSDYEEQRIHLRKGSNKPNGTIRVDSNTKHIYMRLDIPCGNHYFVIGSHTNCEVDVIDCEINLYVTDINLAFSLNMTIGV